MKTVRAIHVVIQISAPLVAFGLKGTIHAILAHEFLHYLELMTRLSNNELISDEISSNLFENVYSCLLYTSPSPRDRG